ncbi:hypothetical protein V6N13_076208 [Hibiscus sabdariffa]|uniref:Uncharacterized protein n=1 Tax=Hibiscus sabdariffa TaxID=183260 RepID=A0ABR1ZV76_9ROSI
MIVPEALCIDSIRKSAMGVVNFGSYWFFRTFKFGLTSWHYQRWIIGLIWFWIVPLGHVNRIGGWISIHEWDDRTFEHIASLWGNFVWIDGETSDAVSFERARSLIEIDWLCNIDEVITLEVEGDTFEIRIVETDRGAVQFDTGNALGSISEVVDERQEEEVHNDKDQVVVVICDVMSDGGVVGDVDVLAQGHSRGAMLMLGSDTARAGVPNEAGLELLGHNTQKLGASE